METLKKDVRSILLIDDDAEDFEFVEEALRQVDPNVSVTLISSCDDISKYKRQKFDLVLLDINMPQHDGFYWLKAIRAHGHADLPIVMYTNSMSPEHIARAYQEGANLYFSKPETFPSLIKSFSRLIQLDWSDPFSITRQYQHLGQYKTFTT